MFKSLLDKVKDVISLDPDVLHGQLYEWARAGRLTCPACEAEVRFNAGDERRRPFFFHRSLLDCKYGEDDPEVIAARASLYTFLATKVTARSGRIDLEVRLDSAPADDLVDVLIQFPGSKAVAYRILKRGLRPSRLEELNTVTERDNAIPRYLLTISRRRWEQPREGEEDSPRLDIPAFDRHLISERSWDRYHVQSLSPIQSRCLVYIDPPNQRLVLYRSVERDWDCNPSIHDYDQEHQATLSDVRILKDGEFVFPDELHLKEQWAAWKTQEEARLAREAELRAKQEAARRAEEERRATLQRQKQEQQELERQRLRAKQEAARRAEEERRATLQRQKQEQQELERQRIAKAFWNTLHQEGVQLLGSQSIDTQIANPYKLPPEEWYPRVLAFAYRAENPFLLHDAIVWMRSRVGLTGLESLEVERQVMRSFWQAAAHLGFVKYVDDGQIVPINRTEAFSWPIRRQQARLPFSLGVCIVCQKLSDDWLTFDPASEVCKCRRCFAPKPRL